MKKLALGLVLGLAVVGLSSAVAQQQGASSADCTRPLARSTLENRSDGETTQRAIAVSCAAVAARSRGIQAALARFYSGRAYNHVSGEGDEAIRQLEIAVNSGQDPEIEGQFRRELRSSRLELVQAYRSTGRLEAARTLLANANLPASDPAVAYQRALLILAEVGEPGRESAFDVLRVTFVQDDTRLLGTPTDPTGLSRAEIRRGRAWLYRLGTSLGREALAQEGQNDEQRRQDALRAINYLGPVASAIVAGCPEGQPIDCSSGIGNTEQIGAMRAEAAPTADQLMGAFVRLGVAHLQAAGVRKMAGLTTTPTTDGGPGALDCMSANMAPDAGSHFLNARDAFETATERAPQGTTVPGARWGQACAILANVSRIPDPGEQQRQLNDAVRLLGDAQDPLILLTRARAEVLQGQSDRARQSYYQALQQIPGAARCPSGDPSPRAQAELPSRLYLEMARTYYTEPLTGARRTSPDLFARAITDIAAARPQGLREAEPSLRCAVGFNYGNSEARLILGHIYLRLQPLEETDQAALDPPPFDKARQALSYFIQPVGTGPEGRPEGLYLLSRRETMLRQNAILHSRGARGDGGAAVRYATQAYNASQRPEYRRQGCTAQMLFGETASGDYCAASGAGDERAESLLYEGMYWLRRGQRQSGGARMASWAQSIQSFNRGLEESSQTLQVDGVHPSLRPQSLEQLLRYGQRYVLTCMNPRYSDPDRASDDVRSFFRLSGMPDPCGGRPS